MYSIKCVQATKIFILAVLKQCVNLRFRKLFEKYFNKAFNHENGNIDFLNLKIEKVKAPIQTIPALPVVENLNDTLTQLAKQTDVSEYALNKGLEYIKNDITYTGAIILSAQTGQRLDSTEQRGIRVTHLAFKTCKRNGEISERVKDARLQLVSMHLKV